LLLSELQGFSESAIDRDIPSDVIMQTADIFAWDIDFFGVGHGKVAVIRFVNQRRVHESSFFIDSKDKSGYYDKKRGVQEMP